MVNRKEESRENRILYALMIELPFRFLVKSIDNNSFDSYEGALIPLNKYITGDQLWFSRKERCDSNMYKSDNSQKQTDNETLHIYIELDKDKF